MKIAIVDDQITDVQRLESYIRQYEKEEGVVLQTKRYLSSVEFLETYKGDFDLILLDIEMPGTDGLGVAKEIRDKDTNVDIIFITSLAQYAIKGYEYNALDYVVKPVRYFTFKVKLAKAAAKHARSAQHPILIKNKEGVVRLNPSDLIYVEKDRDYLVYHTVNEEIRVRGSIKDLREKGGMEAFYPCSSGCLVNFAFVSRIEKDTLVLLDGNMLPVSRRIKKEFTDRYIEYMEGV